MTIYGFNLTQIGNSYHQTRQTYLTFKKLKLKMNEYEIIAVVGLCLLFIIVIVVQHNTNKILEENPVQNVTTPTTVPEDKVNFNNVLLYIVIACIMGVVGLVVMALVIMKKTDRL
jgi:H+/Cl- antiporter ClcA